MSADGFLPPYASPVVREAVMVASAAALGREMRAMRAGQSVARVKTAAKMRPTKHYLTHLRDFLMQCSDMQLDGVLAAVQGEIRERVDERARRLAGPRAGAGGGGCHG